MIFGVLLLFDNKYPKLGIVDDLPDTLFTIILVLDFIAGAIAYAQGLWWLVS